MSHSNENMAKEKHSAALGSVIAAVFLTVVKIVVGIMTGSLGILSEAAHSGLDLIAAMVTLFAVRYADKPADREHAYGHGKMENLSALIETLLLLITCVWIVYEAVKRLFFGEGTVVDANIWAYAIMILSIVINVWRGLGLKRVAKKYNSHALEADALHFMTDVWSSIVVVVGLIFVSLGFPMGDPIAALGVSVLVFKVTIDLGKKAIEVLLDQAPEGMSDKISETASKVPGVVEVGVIRTRASGANCFVDVSVGISRNESHRGVHNIAHQLKQDITAQFSNCDVTVTTYPVDIGLANDREVLSCIKKIVDSYPSCTNVHNVSMYDVAGKKYVSLHMEVREELTLQQSHELSHKIEKEVKEKIDEVCELNVHIETTGTSATEAVDITEKSKDMTDRIISLVNQSSESLNCHDVRLYKRGEKLVTFLHCAVNGDITLREMDLLTNDIESTIKWDINEIEDVYVHMEPAEA